MMKEDELFNLIRMLDSDSESESENAKIELIDALEPIIRAWAEIYSEYGDYNIAMNSQYNPSRGEITGVSYDKVKGRLVFKYTDIANGDIEDYIYVSPDIVSPDYLKRKRKEIKYMATFDIKQEIAKLKERTAELEQFLNKIEVTNDVY